MVKISTNDLPRTVEKTMPEEHLWEVVLRVSFPDQTRTLTDTEMFGDELSDEEAVAINTNESLFATRFFSGDLPPSLSPYEIFATLINGFKLFDDKEMSIEIEANLISVV